MDRSKRRLILSGIWLSTFSGAIAYLLSKLDEDCADVVDLQGYETKIANDDSIAVSGTDIGSTNASESFKLPLNNPAAGARCESKVPLIYSTKYNFKLLAFEKLHSFDSKKYAKIANTLIKEKRRVTSEFHNPEELNRELLLKVHTKAYLDSLSDSRLLSRILEVPILSLVPGPILDWRLLFPMRLASGGSLRACREALKTGLAINVGGGYHHADRNRGGGFCVYCDGPISLKVMKEEGLIKRALIVDTDAHQGNGFANVAKTEKFLTVLDFFDESVYPYPKVEEDFSVPLPRCTNGAKYLSELKSMLPFVLDKVEPDLVFYNAGSDVLVTDPLATLRLTVDDMVSRDLYVVTECRRRNIPLAMALAGGYGPESAIAHTKSIKTILDTFDPI
ncbi:MAG: histone deacetylase [Candidatus Obscuribacterales bacterium]|nr:histone deacetylase [Candidatus Obscuribacterales bacterium]